MKNHCRNIKPINVVKTSIIVSIMRKYLYMKRIMLNVAVSYQYLELFIISLLHHSWIIPKLTKMVLDLT